MFKFFVCLLLLLLFFLFFLFVHFLTFCCSCFVLLFYSMTWKTDTVAWPWISQLAYVTRATSYPLKQSLGMLLGRSRRSVWLPDLHQKGANPRHSCTGSQTLSSAPSDSMNDCTYVIFILMCMNRSTFPLHTINYYIERLLMYTYIYYTSDVLEHKWRVSLKLHYYYNDWF